MKWVNSMIDYEKMNKIYKRNLEESIIAYLATEKEITVAEAMDIYYRSKLSSQINTGEYGIENMDYKYLVHDLIINEPELFKKQ